MVIAYHLQSHPRYAALTTALFKALEQGQASAVASSISLLEILVHPYRQGRPDIARGLRGLLSSLPSLRFVPLDEEIADMAASLRGKLGVRAADAAILATAAREKAELLITNDTRLRKKSPIPLLILEDAVRGRR